MTHFNQTQPFFALGPTEQHVSYDLNQWRIDVRTRSGYLNEVVAFGKQNNRHLECFSFGTNGSFVCSLGKDTGSAVSTKFYCEGLKTEYSADLENWLATKSGLARDFSICLGPNKSYFAWSRDGNLEETKMKGLHKFLEEALNKKLGGAIPNVTLGLDKEFIYWADDGTWTSCLSDKNYPGAAKWLEKERQKGRKIWTASLSAFEKNRLVIVTTMGSNAGKVGSGDSGRRQKPYDEWLAAIKENAPGS